MSRSDVEAVVFQILYDMRLAPRHQLQDASERITAAIVASVPVEKQEPMICSVPLSDEELKDGCDPDYCDAYEAHEQQHPCRAYPELKGLCMLAAPSADERDARITGLEHALADECDKTQRLRADIEIMCVAIRTGYAPPTSHKWTSEDARKTALRAVKLRIELDRMNFIFCPPGQLGPVEKLEAAEEEIARLRAELDRMDDIFCPLGQPGPGELLAAAEEEIARLRAELAQALSKIEGAANMLRGMSIDRRLHQDARDAAIARAAELDEFVERMQP